jgi:periplasmic protein TonB
MSSSSGYLQPSLLIESTSQGMGAASSWVISLVLHAIVIGAVGSLWNAHIVSPPEFQIEVALVDGDSPGFAGKPVPTQAPQEAPIKPTKEQHKERPVRRTEPQPVPVPTPAPVPEQQLTETRSEPKLQPHAESPEPTPARTETALSSPVASAESSPAEPPSLSTAPPIPAVTETNTEPSQVSDSPPTPPMTARLPSSEAQSPAPAPEPDPSHESHAAGPETTGSPLAEARNPQVSRADYGWLADALWNRVEKGKRYPQQARLNQWEGKVVVRAVIREDGALVGLDVARSSGHSVLDEDAMASVRQAFPLRLPRSLGKTQVALQIPISYQLDR